MSGTRKPATTRLSDLGLLQREINELFERLAPFDRPEPHAAGEWIPSVDVYECKGRLMIVAEVPGQTVESLRVVCSDQQVQISGERRGRRLERGAAFLCMERLRGRFTRAIPIDTAVDVARAEANLSRGLLTISIPRVKDRRGRGTEIPIKLEEA